MRLPSLTVSGSLARNTGMTGTKVFKGSSLNQSGEFNCDIVIINDCFFIFNIYVIASFQHEMCIFIPTDLNFDPEDLSTIFLNYLFKRNK